MSDSSKNNSSGGNLSRGAIAVLGLVIVLVIVGLINYAANAVGWKADLTENKLYTLSEGTESILDRLETPVTVRYYVTDDADVMSPSERARARRVQDLLNTYVSAAPIKEVELLNQESGEFEKRRVKMLKVEKLNPEPNTDAEDSAMSDGLQEGVSGETNNPLYFGLAVQCIDESEVIPFLPAVPETRLEYDLSRAIANVHGGSGKTVRVMTSMPVGGGMGANFQAPPTPAWFFYDQLSKDYTVETIEPSATEIPEDTDVLFILHPFDVSEATEFAIDQYLLNGGNVIAMVDPNFFYAEMMGQPAQVPGMPAQGGPPPASNLENLFKAWGVKYDSTEVLADLSFGSELMRRGNFVPTFLTLDSKAISPSEDGPNQITGMINHLNMLTPGAFEKGEVPEGVKFTSLVQSSPINQMVSPFEADPRQQEGIARLRENFESYDKPRDLVVQLTGTFKSAFPDGDPSAVEEEPEPEEADEEPAPKADDAKAPAKADAKEEPKAEKANAPAKGKPKSAPKADKKKAPAKGDAKADTGEAPKADDAKSKGGKSSDDAKAEGAEPSSEEPAVETPEEDAGSDCQGPDSEEEESDEEIVEPPAPEKEPKPEALKKSVKPGMVILFADVDFIYTEIIVRLQSIPGLNAQFAQPLNENLTLVQNSVELLSGDPSLINVRSRQNVRRPFTKQSEWMAEANEKYQEQIDEFQKKSDETVEKLNEIIQRTPQQAGGEVILPPDAQAQIEKLREDQVEFSKKTRELQKEVTREFKQKLAWYKFGNSLFMPLLVILFGIGLAVRRHFKTAAR